MASDCLIQSKHYTSSQYKTGVPVTSNTCQYSFMHDTRRKKHRDGCVILGGDLDLWVDTGHTMGRPKELWSSGFG